MKGFAGRLGIYVLSQDVKNPNVDRRKSTNDWLYSMPVWPKGMRLFAAPLDGNYKNVVIHNGRKSKLYHPKRLPNELKDAMEPAEPRHLHDVIEATDTSAEAILGQLLKEGTITYDQLIWATGAPATLRAALKRRA